MLTEPADHLLWRSLGTITSTSCRSSPNNPSHGELERVVMVSCWTMGQDCRGFEPWFHHLVALRSWEDGLNLNLSPHLQSGDNHPACLSL